MRGKIVWDKHSIARQSLNPEWKQKEKETFILMCKVSENTLYAIPFSNNTINRVERWVRLRKNISNTQNRHMINVNTEEEAP